MIDLNGHSYAKEETVEISGNTFMGIMQLLQKIYDLETHDGFGLTYSKSAKKKVNKEHNIVESIELELEEYPSSISYMRQPVQKFTTMLGNIALDLLMNVQQVHKINIEKGIAKPYGELQVKETPVIKL